VGPAAEGAGAKRRAGAHSMALKKGHFSLDAQQVAQKRFTNSHQVDSRSTVQDVHHPRRWQSDA